MPFAFWLRDRMFFRLFGRKRPPAKRSQRHLSVEILEGRIVPASIGGGGGGGPTEVDWIGGNGDWSNGANWSTGSAPGVGDLNATALVATGTLTGSGTGTVLLDGEIAIGAGGSYLRLPHGAVRLVRGRF